MSLVSLEGIDASSKFTQSKKLAKYLSGRGPGCRRVTVQAFPDYSTRTGKAVLGLLKEEWHPYFAQDSAPMSALKPLLLQTLMTVNRHEKYDLLMEYKESPDKFLICDRYFASGLAYGMADGLDSDYLAQIHRGLPSADLWIMLDITPEESIRRRPERRDEYERRPGLLEQVRLNYLKLFKEPQFSGLWSVVDGMQSEQNVHDQIVSIVDSCFNR